MQYQLVLQFRGDSLEDFDKVVAVEDALIEALGDSADVDGHDVGSGETNIFLFTADPKSTFECAKPVLETRNLLNSVTAAYRGVDDDRFTVFTVIWPENRKGDTNFTVA